MNDSTPTIYDHEPLKLDESPYDSISRSFGQGFMMVPSIAFTALSAYRRMYCYLHPDRTQSTAFPDKSNQYVSDTAFRTLGFLTAGYLFLNYAIPEIRPLVQEHGSSLFLTLLPTQLASAGYEIKGFLNAIRRHNAQQLSESLAEELPLNNSLENLLEEGSAQIVGERVIPGSSDS